MDGVPACGLTTHEWQRLLVYGGGTSPTENKDKGCFVLFVK